MLVAGPHGRSTWVSILVFLDDAHRPKLHIVGIGLVFRFQSLFSWMTLIGEIRVRVW